MSSLYKWAEGFALGMAAGVREALLVILCNLVLGGRDETWENNRIIE